VQSQSEAAKLEETVVKMHN